MSHNNAATLRDLDRQTDALLHVAGVIDRLVTRGERPTRSDVNVLDAVYAEAAQAARPAKRDKRPPITADDADDDGGYEEQVELLRH
jgi:hypothetical protein